MRLLLGGLFMVAASGAFAQDFNQKDFMVANEAGQIVGGADLCGYKLDDAKLEAFMQNKIANLDDTSRMHFSNVRGTQQVQLSKMMSDTERKAQCALQAKLAEKYGLTP
ncbi:hypothetical protein ELG88_09805 [Rhizobium leguminosarum]|uniref:hypothetical protein n=1 Tax=Rhizobium leguminosarum TaxID=384 RepID=UPI00102F6372|nr:hypothetical protein [Rhizobium leguminosarum]TAY66553.1 hypothetical protein ELH82_10330 [Rhizobium leguminosarum]TBF35480.1 hypothetical protein ELG88_09805 [Rhizobium leguminosarum]